MNFQNSLQFLEEAIKIERPNIIEKAGLIQFFEITFELSWNVLKDYLEEQGFSDLRYPRECIKKAFETGLLTDGHVWLEALTNRNLTSHVYDETMADSVIAEIKNKYYPFLKQLYNKLKAEL